MIAVATYIRLCVLSTGFFARVRSKVRMTAYKARPRIVLDLPRTLYRGKHADGFWFYDISISGAEGFSTTGDRF